MAAIDYLQPYTQDNRERNRTPEPPSLPNREEAVKALIEDYTDQLDNRIQEVLEATHTSINDSNPDYQSVDVSGVANEVWKALDQMDDSPIGQIMNGVIYGATETATQIVGAAYDALASRYGEKLTTTINDADSYSQLVSPIVEQLQAEIEVPVEMTNSSRDAEHIAQQVVDYLAPYVSQESPENEPVVAPSQTTQQQEIER